MASRTVHSVCSHDCPDSCGVLVTIDEAEKATRVQGDPNHPVTQGFLCGKVAKYLERVYSPDRLLYPMRRRAGVAKGLLAQGREAEAFERISWDEALEEIAERLKQISEKYGPESILPYSYAGTIGVLGYGSMDRRFFHRLGASQLDRTICSTAGGDALLSVYGRKLGTDTEDFRYARLIIAWGGNVHGNNIHLWPLIEEARRNGAKLVVIDPYRTKTARLADWHIPVNIGTDAALALGMMHVLIRDGLYDREYVEKHTHGFEQLRDRAAEYTPERAARWTGVPAADIEKLAREYATAKPAAIRLNYGIQRSENGGASVRAVVMLPALTGAWKQRGGGLQLSTSGAFPWDKQTVERPDLMYASPLGRPARVVNMSLLGHALMELDGPRVHAMFVYNSNPAAIAPDQSQVLRGMAREDLFTVVHEQFFTDTADYADIVLPATTFLEHKDVQGAYGHYYVGLSNRAIEPLGEARSNVWLFSELARRMGFREKCFEDTEDDLIAQALWQGKAQPAWFEGITATALDEAGGHIRLRFEAEAKGGEFLPFADGGFGTPSGKAEFYSEALGAQGLDPLPGFVAPKESRHGAGNNGDAGRYPLEFLPRKADNYMNTTFANMPGHQKMEKGRMGTLEMHAMDAAARGIADGDAVEVFNARGAITLTARVWDRDGDCDGDGERSTVQPGVVSSRLSWNKLSRGGNNVNLLTSQRLTDFGGGPTFYSTLVDVRKCGG
jgi:anaerobic selenocysteine-containing dehydrogenase